MADGSQREFTVRASPCDRAQCVRCAGRYGGYYFDYVGVWTRAAEPLEIVL